MSKKLIRIQSGRPQEERWFLEEPERILLLLTTGAAGEKYLADSNRGSTETETRSISDSESGGVHFDPANPFSPLGQTWLGESAGEVEGEEEGGGAGLEVTDADLEQQPSSSGANAEMARDGALALSDEEVLEEAMGREQ